MNYIDTKYIGLVSSQLLKFTEKKKGTYNFRCPYCGDSEKKQNKARGYLFSMRDSFVYKCHNCGVTRNFSQFLKDQSVNLHDEYVMERYKEGMTGKNYQVKTPDFKPFVTKPVFKKNIFSELPSIDSLNITHPAKQYLLDRKIPESFYSNFYYAEDFNAWENNQNTIKEPRIILPLISEDGNVFGYQARSLNKNATLRYITTILDKQYPKLFGLDRINKNENIYITEGPFDSLFIRNSIAMCGADVYLGDWGIDNPTWIYDNEPRNKQIVERINKTIQHGNKVVIWPDSIKEKDINDMFLAGHNVQSVVECNTYSGLEAQVKFNLWKKI
jgi:DNA-directed RNA polymerase subunit RPC12/RpoP